MSCEDSVIFFANLAYIPHIRQNQPTFPPIGTNINLKKVTSTGFPFFSKLKMNKLIFGEVFFKIIQADKSMIGNLSLKKKILNTF